MTEIESMRDELAAVHREIAKLRVDFAEAKSCIETGLAVVCEIGDAMKNGGIAGVMGSLPALMRAFK